MTKVMPFLSCQTQTSGADDVLNLEVTVQYSGAPSAGGTDVTCNGGTYSLVATAGVGFIFLLLYRK